MFINWNVIQILTKTKKVQESKKEKKWNMKYELNLKHSSCVGIKESCHKF